MESEVRNRKTNSNKTKTTVDICNAKTRRSECVATPVTATDNNERADRLLDNEPAAAAVDSASESHRNDKCNKSENLPVPELASFADDTKSRFNIAIDVDPMSVALLLIAFCTRIYRLAEPNNIV